MDLNTNGIVGLTRLLRTAAVAGIAVGSITAPASAQATNAEQCLASIERPAGENGEQVVGLCIEALKLDPNAAPLIYSLARTLYGMQHYERAIELYTNLAGRGFAPAQTALGIAYYKGEGVPQDHGAAAAWFRQAAEGGYASAQNNLGQLYLNGQGVEKSDAEAMRWFAAAADQGHEAAKANALALYERYRETAVDMRDEVAAEMEALAARIASTEQRIKGLEAIQAEDYATAAGLLLGPAEAGDAESRHYLGLIYLLGGHGVEPNANKARSWFEQASAQGYEKSTDALAQMDATEDKMGMPLSEGWRLEDINAGVEALKSKEYRRAIDLLAPHAEFLEPVVQLDIGRLYAFPTGQIEGVEYNGQEALRWVKLAAAQGYQPAIDQLEQWRVK